MFPLLSVAVTLVQGAVFNKMCVMPHLMQLLPLMVLTTQFKIAADFKLSLKSSALTFCFGLLVSHGQTVSFKFLIWNDLYLILT